MAEIFYLEDTKTGYFKNVGCCLVIGFFDGVHLGHKKIIEECLKRSEKSNKASIVLTFDKPPLNVVKSKIQKKLIVTFSEKLRLISMLNVDYIVVARLNESFLKLEPRDFCRQILLDRFNIKEIVVGEDFRFGYKAKGDAGFLKDFFKNFRIKISVISLKKYKEEVISSTRIRRYYSEGKVNDVAKLLGREPYVIGKVIEGEGRGRILGFPTANIDVCKALILPRDGVYFGETQIDEGKKSLPSLINIGYNPTFGNNKKHIESYIIDFAENIYNKMIKISFLKRLRDEVGFETKEKLVAQMNKDLEAARKFFKF